MNCVVFGVTVLFLGSLTLCEAKLREGDCDVCIKFLTKFGKTLSDNDRSSHEKIREKIQSACKNTKGKDDRFCYYVGATEDAATMILNEITKPMVNFVPPERICEKLKRQDAQICDLQYGENFIFMDFFAVKVTGYEEFLKPETKEN